MREDGHLLLPRLIRYLEERRQNESRWTGAIETHPSPVTIVWGDLDPIAVWEMTERLSAAPSDAVRDPTRRRSATTRWSRRPRRLATPSARPSTSESP